MRAVQLLAPRQIEVTDVPEPGGGGDVVIRSKVVGICGTDIKILNGHIPVDHPRTMGHELVGTIVSGRPGTPFTDGTHVLVDPAVSCGWCDLCIRGRTNLCRNGGLMGRDVDGVFSEYVSAPVGRLVAIPDNIPGAATGLLQVLGTCVHAVGRLDIVPGTVAAVVGMGVTGQLIAQLLTLSGARVVAVTRSDWKLRLATDLGADQVATPDNAAGLLSEITSGRGPGIVVEAVGSERTLAQAIELVGIGGEILVFGTITAGEEGLPYYELYHKELTLHNPRAAVTGDYADAVVLAATGKIQLSPLVTHEFTLAEAPQAMAAVTGPSSLKVLMTV